MSNLVFFGGKVADWFYEIWIGLWLLIDQVVFSFINWIYRVFILVAKVDIFGGGEQIRAIANRIYVIVGVAMLFIFAYNLILLVINPEGKQLGDMGKIVKNAIISIVLVTLLPTIFSYLTTLQVHVIDSNVIAQIILGSSNDSDIEATNKKAGVEAAMTIFSAFYHPKNQSVTTCEIISTDDTYKGHSDYNICDTYYKAYRNAYDNESIASFVLNSELRQETVDGNMEYNWILSTVAGIFALWMFISFALDIGVRVGKIAFYELISPVPVMMRILPNDKMFDKWLNGFKNAYLSLFVRLVIIYFCMYAITLVPDVVSNLWASYPGENKMLLLLANVVIILGILMFAKDAPKLISDMFGGSGDGIKFGIKDKLKDNALIGAVRGGVYGATTGAGWGRVSGFFGGARRGAFRGYDNAVSGLDSLRDAKEDGSTWGGRMSDRLRVAAGMRTRYDSVGADVENQMKRNKVEKRREHNKIVADAISTLKDKAGSVVTDKDSTYTSDGNYYSVSDLNTRKTYSLNNKNYYEMQAVLEEAKRDNASSETITNLEREIDKYQKKTKDRVMDDALKGDLSNIQGRYQSSMQNAIQDLQEQVAEGAAETINLSTGELTSGIKDSSGNVITKISDVSQLKAADNAVKASNRDIDIIERNIKKRDASFKAKKADRDYINNSKNKNGK